MKPHGSHFEFKQQRNDDLMRAYHELIKQAAFVSMPEIYKMVVDMPTCRFWVSEERAIIVIHSMMKGDKLTNRRKPRREMYNEIYRRVMCLHEKNPEMPIYRLVAQVVEQPAPKFYITPGSAKTIICNIRKEWYFQRTKRRLRHCF